MFHGLSHVDIPVSDLARAELLYGGVLGFAQRRRGDGYVDLDSASTQIRLVLTGHVAHPVTIRVLAADVEGGIDALVKRGARLLYAPMRTPEQELFAQVADFDGNVITVWRPLSEDEYDQAPELPTNMAWQPQSEALLKSLLAHVPALFRALARRKVVLHAERLALRQGLASVDDDTVVRGYILAAARIMRNRLRQPLLAHGYDPERYPDEFAAE